MTTTHDGNTLAPPANALADLRARANQPPAAIADAFEVADQQAQLLRRLLPHPVEQLPTRLPELIPTIRVTYVDDIPVAGTSFWALRSWHIHVRASDPADVQVVTVLHELKHIIDHPLRRHYPDLFSDSEWEAMADHFAASVLADQSSRMVAKRKEEL